MCSSTSRCGSPAAARRRAELDDRATDVGVEAAGLTGLDTREELLEALAALPPRQRTVIVLRYFLDLTETETAKALGCSTGTVNCNASKALAHLRESLIPARPATEVCEP